MANDKMPAERIEVVPDARHRRYLSDETFRRLVDSVAAGFENGLMMSDLHDAVQHACVVRAYDQVDGGG